MAKKTATRKASGTPTKSKSAKGSTKTAKPKTKPAAKTKKTDTAKTPEVKITTKTPPKPKVTSKTKPSTKTKTKKSAAKAVTFDPPSHEQISIRAFEIWMGKGRPFGQDKQIWHQAEAELAAEA